VTTCALTSSVAAWAATRRIRTCSN